MVQVKAYSKMTVCPLPASGRYKGAEFESLSWDQFRKKYGFSSDRRRDLMARLDSLLNFMDRVGYKIREVSIYGSFVTDKENPGDIDVAIWHDSLVGSIAVADIISANQLAKEYGIDPMTLSSLGDYCYWLGIERERGSNRVIRLTNLPRITNRPRPPGVVQWRE